MPALRTDLGFGGLTTPSGYWNEMIMGGGEEQPLEEVAPSQYAPEATMPSPGIAGGYSSYEESAPPPGNPYAEPVPAPTPEPQPVYLDQAVGPGDDPYGAYGSVQPLPWNSTTAPLEPPRVGPYTGPNYLSGPVGDLDSMPGQLGYGGVGLDAFAQQTGAGGRQVTPAPASDPYVTQLPRTGERSLLPTPTPFSPTIDAFSGMHADRGMPMAQQQSVLRGTWGRGNTATQSMVDPYADYATQRSDIRTLPAQQPPAQQGDPWLEPNAFGWAPGTPASEEQIAASSWTSATSGRSLGPDAWVPDYANQGPLAANPALGYGPLPQEGGGFGLEDVVTDLTQPLQMPDINIPDIDVPNPFDKRKPDYWEHWATVARAQPSDEAPFFAVRRGGGSIPGISGALNEIAEQAQAAPFAPYGGTRSDIMTLPAGSQQPRAGASQGATNPGGVTTPTTGAMDSDEAIRHRATKLLTPDLQFVNSERTSDAWAGGAGANQVRVVYGEGTDRYATDALVTPDSVAAAEGQGMRTWRLDDTEFQALVDAGLVKADAQSSLIRETLLIPKDWVDALGSVSTTPSDEQLTNVQDVIAVDPYAGGGDSSGGAGGSGSGGGSRRSSGGGGGRSSSGGGGWSDWSGQSGGTSAPAWMSFGGDDGDTWNNPVFARYFDVLSRHFGAERAEAMMRGGFGRRLGRKGRSRTVGGKRMKTKGRSSVRVPGGSSVEFSGDSIRNRVQASAPGKKDRQKDAA